MLVGGLEKKNMEMGAKGKEGSAQDGGGGRFFFGSDAQMASRRGGKCCELAWECGWVEISIVISLSSPVG